MAILTHTASRIYIWRHGDAATAGAIDSGNPHLTKWIIIQHAPQSTQGNFLYIFDQSLAYFFTLAVGERTPKLPIDDTRLIHLGGSTATVQVEVLALLQEGGSW